MINGDFHPMVDRIPKRSPLKQQLQEQGDHFSDFRDLLCFPACLCQESTVFAYLFGLFTTHGSDKINRGEASEGETSSPINPRNDHFFQKHDGGNFHLPKNHGKFFTEKEERHHETPWNFLGHAHQTPKRCNLRQASEVATRHIHIWSLIDMPQGGSRHLYPQPQKNLADDSWIFKSWVVGKMFSQMVVQK